MKILHTSDLHIGRYLNEYSLLDDQIYMLGQILSTASENSVDVIVISGDLFDRSVPSSQAVAALDEFFYRALQLGIKIIAVCGNHDGRQRLGFLSRMSAASGIYLKNEFDSENAKITLSDEFGSVNFYAVPYIEPSDIENSSTFNEAFIKAVGLLSFDESERNVIIAHGFFANVGEENKTLFSESEISVGPADMISAASLKKFDYAALGHLHRRQNVGSESICYSGSPLKYSVDEASHKKSVTIVTLGEKGDISATEIPLSPLRDVRKLKGAFEDILRPLPDSEYLNDYVFVEITDDSLIPDAMAQLREVYPNILGMRIISRDKERRAVLNIDSDMKKKSPLKLFDEFYSALKGEQITDERQMIAEDVFKAISNKREE